MGYSRAKLSCGVKASRVRDSAQSGVQSRSPNRAPGEGEGVGEDVGARRMLEILGVSVALPPGAGQRLRS